MRLGGVGMFSRQIYPKTSQNPPERTLMNGSSTIAVESPSQLRSEHRVRVSTIIPAFNAEHTIAEAIDSALMQEIDSHEIVVVNDGSTDSTPEILEGYGNKIRFVNQRNGGLSAARNAGVAQSSGRYLAFLDSDDVWLPGKLVTLIAALERNPLASLAFSKYGFIDENGIEYRTSCFVDEVSIRQLMMERPLPLHSFKDSIKPSTWVVPRSMLERSNGFCEAFKGAQGYEDSWMLLLLRDLGEFVYVPKKLTLYREPPQAAIADKYLPGVPTFVRLVKRRYGRRGKALIRCIRDSHCRQLLSKIAHQMDRGDRAGAMHSLLRIAKLRPSYFLSFEFTGRLLLPQNLKRVRDLGSMAGRNRSQSAT
jgi:glycosyltransferase involved in cell wall biosynthesis